MNLTIELSQEEKSNAQLAKGRLTSYTVPENEKDTFHVELENVSFTPGGEKRSKPYVQKFEVRAWLQFDKHAAGFTHRRILYAPPGDHGYKGEGKEERQAAVKRQ